MSEWIEGDFVPFDIGYIGKPTLPDIDPSGGGGGEDSPALRALSGGVLSSDSDSSYTLSSIKDDKWGKGFIFKHCYVRGGTEEFPVGDTDALRRQRAEVLLTKIAQCLLDCNVGWQLDSSRCNSLTDYTNMDVRNSTVKYPALFFRNTISGCKLFMGYSSFTNSSRYPKDFTGNDLIKHSGAASNPPLDGLLLSIIPDSSTSEFGEPNTEGFFPADATRVCGTFFSNFATTTNTYFSAANRTQDGMYYPYWIGATPYTLITYAHHNPDFVPGLFFPCFVCGRIFDVLVNEDDTLPNARYGTLLLRNNRQDYESWCRILTSDFSSYWLYGSAFGEYTQYIYGYFGNYSGNTTILSSVDTFGAISKADGNWVNGNSSDYNVIAFPENPTCLSPRLVSLTDSSRSWSPICMAVVSTNLDTYGVVPGNGIKGYLDTNLFRAALGKRKETFNNGTFACLETKSGMLIGWDSSNEDQWIE